MKKILIYIFLILILSGCSTTYKRYSFDDQPISYTPNKEYEKYIYIYGGLMDVTDEKTSLSYIVIAPIRYEVIDGKAYRSKRVEVLSDKVKIIYKDKEYYLPISKDNMVIEGEGEYIWTIQIPSGGQVVRLDEAIPDATDDELEIYFGKVKVDGTRIVEVPPVKFKKYIFITKVNLFLDGLNIDAEKTIYLGTLEEYKKDRRKAIKEYKKLQKEKEKAEKKKEEKQNIFKTLKEIWTS